MTGKHTSLPENPKDAFARYILELEHSYQPWYERASRFNKIMFVIGQGTAILAGATTAFVAALVGEQGFAEVKWLLVLLPLVGAFATALLAQTRVRDILALRENGRQQIEALIDTARAAYAVPAASEEAITKQHYDLISEVSRLEKQQAVDILSIVPIPGSKSGGPNAEEQK
jgi:hypothetical protein